VIYTDTIEEVLKFFKSDSEAIIKAVIKELNEQAITLEDLPRLQQQHWDALRIPVGVKARLLKYISERLND
jgi:hypothetical protein